MIDDDGESVLLGFDTSLLSRVSAGATATATVSIVDDDGAGVTVSEASLTIDDGGSGTYTIKLDSQPTANVTVTINDPTDNTDVTAEPGNLIVHLERLEYGADSDGDRRRRTTTRLTRRPP